MPAANVQSIEAIRDFRSSLIVFAQHVNESLESMKEQVFYAVDRIESESPRYWHQQELKSFDGISEARVQLETGKMRKQMDGFRPSLIEEKKALETAKKRLTYCQEKVRLVKATAVKVRHEADEFQGRMSQLERLVEYDLPKMVGLLDGMLKALEAYAEVSTKDIDESGLE